MLYPRTNANVVGGSDVGARVLGDSSACLAAAFAALLATRWAGGWGHPWPHLRAQLAAVGVCKRPQRSAVAPSFPS